MYLREIEGWFASYKNITPQRASRPTTPKILHLAPTKIKYLHLCVILLYKIFFPCVGGTKYIRDILSELFITK